ncbi:PREDICTED: receptor-type tyrosine-protein phosphatase eta [Elephantulus edwardii]|uniref:receptor-type tyrosine-protein phosphatase eta n=1 Tax=Elephantulus edwardii TaxID=28737 RepID=UPI0003F0586D|nr:PREDICTED: receptor-type tyrosine-protein phosphatase eta [Elephantulus edwardii]
MPAVTACHDVSDPISGLTIVITNINSSLGLTDLESQGFGIRVTNASDTSLNLTWDSDNTASSYKVQVVEKTGSVTLTVNETHSLISGLIPGTLYNITVYTVPYNGSESAASFLQVYTLAKTRKKPGRVDFTVKPTMDNFMKASTTKTSSPPPGPVSDFHVTSVTTTEIGLAWSSNNSESFRIITTWDGSGEPWAKTTITASSSIVISGLNPGTKYNFEIVPQGPNGTEWPPLRVHAYTKPPPVSGLRVTVVGVTDVTLTWISDNGTDNCRMQLESVGGQKEMVVNISNLKPGTRQNVSLSSPESSKRQENPEEANNPERSPREVPPAAPGDGYSLGPADPSSHQDSRATEVRLVGLKPGMPYKATVFSQAADGTEGQAQDIEFRTKSNCQVFDIQVVNISATSMKLTWKIKNRVSTSIYTFKIQVVGETQSFNLTANETQVLIAGLTSSSLYNITMYPVQDGGSEGTPGSLQVYTTPGPVSDFHVTSVTTTEIGLAWTSNDSESFRIVTTQAVSGEPGDETITSDHSIVIRGLTPGTMYNFEIFPQGPNGTEGPSQSINHQTKFSAVFEIRMVSVTMTEMRLEWKSTDSASLYTYQVHVQSKVSFTKTTREKAITLQQLSPGTLYNITITPVVHGVQGNSSSIAEYTRPSSVSNIEISPNTTAAVLSWQSFDNAPSAYTYRLRIDSHSSTQIEIITDAGVTNATVTGLIPGSSYTVQIFARAGNITEGAPSFMPFCTDAAPVDFRCEMVPKEPTLVLVYACPDGVNAGFSLEVSGEAFYNETYLEGCSSDNDTVDKIYRTEVTYLNFSTSYNISITTLSCGMNGSSTPNLCTTSITDPPPPNGSPNITSISHNSVKVKFSGFESSHGPIKAYALILTTGKAERPTVDVLKYRYEDFKNNSSETYVTYLITTEERQSSQGLSEVLKYEIDVGNESTTCGYFNGKLKPLGSYRACVAGFTNITFNPQNRGLIDGANSYVTFSNYSDAVFLPQDPGVICGAVFGCIFGALVIVAVGGFIFWRKKRKDAKNNEVSFSQIKPKKSKLIRVENFEAYFKKQQADSNCGFAEEYEDLKLVGISQPKYAAELAENRGKNRYNNVLPYDISRVKLSVQTQSTDDYINANYMPGYHSKRDFIATQGPLPNTLKDFWRMVWEKNVYAIIMLTKCVEQGRTKCEEYWPSKKIQDYGDITVAMASEIILPEWTIRDFTVKNIQTSESHPLRQFHFTSWPDHGVPDTTDLLINFRYLVRDYMKQSPPESPILVHCSAGVGRTGTFIAIDRLIYQMENENTVDVYGIVYDLRMHRPLMVQTEDQYVFLNQCVLDIIRSQRDSKVDLIYQNTTAMTIYENMAPAPVFGKTNGYIA